jgi:SAM-dependent methyltransferase
MPDSDSITRFSNRVENYVRFRPGYPPALTEALAAEVELSEATIVADIGSGTGFSSEPFLGLGCTVYAVEPNDGMRGAAEARLGGHRGFRSIAGMAEATTLQDSCVDLVVAGQAFHWFDPSPTRDEFRRILRPGGRVAVFWNSRSTEPPFNAEYEELVARYALDRRYLDCRRGDAGAVTSFFAEPPASRRFPNSQEFDLAGLIGRTESSSYTPPQGHPDHAPLLEGLAGVFSRHQRAGTVTFEYETELFVGGI